MSKVKHCALVLGGHVNGYSIIRELFECGLRDIALFDQGKSIASKSNKVTYYRKIDNSIDTLKNEILFLKNSCEKIVIFPTNDLQIEQLNEIYFDISNFCYIPFNHKTVMKSLDKTYQYQCCAEIGVPFPQTIIAVSHDDLRKISTMDFPVLVKPVKRDDLKINIFRNMYIKDIEGFNKKYESLANAISQGVKLMISEVIPGDDTNIYAYVAYRSKKGEILNEWIGKKLNQYPGNFGVFSSACNDAPEIVAEQGRKLVNHMNLMGICEPEFRYDPRDKKYKLMEINLRSMMWHRLGNLCGVNIQYTQYQDAIGRHAENQLQILDKKRHFIFMTHEILNLIFRRGYWKFFKHNLFSSKVREFAVYCPGDIKPFLYSIYFLIISLGGRCLKALKTK